MNFTGTWDPGQWTQKETGDQFDVGRHYGAVGMANIMPAFQSQLGDVQEGVNQRRGARNDLNRLMSPIGRNQQVQTFGNNRRRRGYQMGQQLAGRMMAQGMGDQSGATDLWAANQAAQDTNDYAANMESPDSLGQISRYAMDLNSSTEVLDLLKALGLLDAQDAPRQQFHEQMSAQDASQNGLGGIIGTLAGLAMPGGGGAGMSALMKLFGGGNSGAVNSVAKSVGDIYR